MIDQLDTATVALGIFLTLTAVLVVAGIVLAIRQKAS